MNSISDLFHPEVPLWLIRRVFKTMEQCAQHSFQVLTKRRKRERAQRFILQLLVSIVAEDIGLFPREIVTELLYESSEKGGNSYDLFGGLFPRLGAKELARGERSKRPSDIRLILVKSAIRHAFDPFAGGPSVAG